MKPTEILIQSFEIKEKLRAVNDFKENRIVNTLGPVAPFQIGNEIKLIIIGQDPTVKNEKSREKITCTLNLDKTGALKNYISNVCKGLNLELSNIYATNVFKYFYTIPPAQTMYVLQAHLQPNLELLNSELAAFPNAKIITLGEPVLQLLAGEKKQVKNFWDYNRRTKKSDDNYLLCKANDNKLGRDFFPFPHQPSIRKEFYMNHLAKYIRFVKNH